MKILCRTAVQKTKDRGFIEAVKSSKSFPETINF